MNSESYSCVMKSVWSLAGGGLSQLTIEGISHASGVSLAEIRALFPEQYHIVLAIIEDIKRQVNMPATDSRLSPRDQIFDAIMMCFDTVQPHRLAIKRLYLDVIWKPGLLMRLLPSLSSLGQGISRRYLAKGKAMNAAQELALNGAFIYALHTFVDDESFDLSPTMASLDSALKLVDDLSHSCRQFCTISK